MKLTFSTPSFYRWPLVVSFMNTFSNQKNTKLLLKLLVLLMVPQKLVLESPVLALLNLSWLWRYVLVVETLTIIFTPDFFKALIPVVMSGIIAVYGLVVAVLLAGQCKSCRCFCYFFIYLFFFQSVTNRWLFLILVSKRSEG